MHNKSTLIIRLPNWVGDTIMCLPTIQALQIKGIKLHLYGKPWIHDLLAGLNLPMYSLSANFTQSYKTLAAIESSNILLLTNSFSSGLMAKFARKKAFGYKSDYRSLLLNKAIRKPKSLHEVEYFWQLAEAATQHFFPECLSLPLSSLPTNINLPLTQIAINQAKKKLHTINIKSPYIVLCPFAQGKGGNGVSKIWPYWAELSTKMQNKNVIVCPGKSEEVLCSTLVPHAKILSGLNLAEYAAVLAQAEKVIANDSGPLHIAAAVAKNTLGIFGTTDPYRTSPWGAAYVGGMDRWPDLDEVVTKLTHYY